MNMHITVVVVRGQLYEFYVCVRQKAARLSESCVVLLSLRLGSYRTSLHNAPHLSSRSERATFSEAQTLSE
jgi:hypothetical protein